MGSIDILHHGRRKVHILAEKLDDNENPTPDALQSSSLSIRNLFSKFDCASCGKIDLNEDCDLNETKADKYFCVNCRSKTTSTDRNRLSLKKKFFTVYYPSLRAMLARARSKSMARAVQDERQKRQFRVLHLAQNSFKVCASFFEQFASFPGRVFFERAFGNERGHPMSTLDGGSG